MASSATSLVKLFSTTSKTCSLTSTPTLFPLHSFLSIPSKPSKPTNISYSSSSSLSSPRIPFPKINKLSLFNMVTHVAQFSEGAAVEELTAEEIVAAQDPEGEGEIEEEEEEESFADPPEEAKLFVGNLPYDVDSEALANLFNQAGVVEIAEVIYNRETGQSRGFGFVTMNTVEEAEAVVEKFNRYDINGRSLTVNRAAPRGSPRPEQTPRTFVASNRIYIGNLPWQADDARLEQVFSEHGKVVDARVVYDRETQRSRGFGFVTMSNETEVNDAIAALDGQTLDGRAIRVNVAEEKPRRSSF